MHATEGTSMDSDEGDLPDIVDLVMEMGRPGNPA